MRIILLPVVAFMVMACAHNAEQPVATQTPGGGTAVTASSIQVRTSANGLLGYGLEIDDDDITILTTTGWIVELNYDGTFSKNAGYGLRYSGTGCTGSVYLGQSGVVYGKSLYYDGTDFYKPASSPNNQAAVTVTYHSQKTPTCNDFTDTKALIPLLPSTGPTEAGLPATITGPIFLQAP